MSLCLGALFSTRKIFVVTISPDDNEDIIYDNELGQFLGLFDLKCYLGETSRCAVAFKRDAKCFFFCRKNKYKEVRNETDEVPLNGLVKTRSIHVSNLKQYVVQNHANSDHGFFQEFEVSYFIYIYIL